MSACKCFFIKSNTNEFLPIGEFNRGTEVYRYCCAPYEKIKPLTNDSLNQIVCDIESGMEFVKRGIQADKNKQSLVAEEVKMRCMFKPGFYYWLLTSLATKGSDNSSLTPF